jgi:hypothetical protein
MITQTIMKPGRAGATPTGPAPRAAPAEATRRPAPIGRLQGVCYPARRLSPLRELGVSARARSISSLIAFCAFAASFAAIAVNTRR